MTKTKRADKDRKLRILNYVAGLPDTKEEVMLEMTSILKSPSRRADVAVALRGMMYLAELAKADPEIEWIGKILITWIDMHGIYVDMAKV